MYMFLLLPLSFLFLSLHSTSLFTLFQSSPSTFTNDLLRELIDTSLPCRCRANFTPSILVHVVPPPCLPPILKPSLRVALFTRSPPPPPSPTPRLLISSTRLSFTPLPPSILSPAGCWWSLEQSTRKSGALQRKPLRLSFPQKHGPPVKLAWFVFVGKTLFWKQANYFLLLSQTNFENAYGTALLFEDRETVSAFQQKLPDCKDISYSRFSPRQVLISIPFRRRKIPSLGSSKWHRILVCLVSYRVHADRFSSQSTQTESWLT